MTEDPCTTYSRDNCGRYPTCKKNTESGGEEIINRIQIRSLIEYIAESRAIDIDPSITPHPFLIFKSSSDLYHLDLPDWSVLQNRKRKTNLR